MLTEVVLLQKGIDTMSKQNTFVILSRTDGLKISVLTSVPELKEGKKLRGVVQILHGMCEYKERYQELIKYLNDRGFACVIHDHRGHGASVNRKDDLGYMYGVGAEGFLDDILQINDWIAKEFPGVPVILFGHSMGSLAARSFVKEHDDRVKALILSGPPSNNPGRLGGTMLAKLQRKVRGARSRGELIEKLAFGGYVAQCPESRCAWVCSDREVVRKYENDPFCRFTFTVDAYLVLFEMMRRTYDSRGWVCSQPKLPILFLGGADDPCIGGEDKFNEELDYMQRVGYGEVTGKLYTGMRHEICNETRKEVVYQDIVDFLQQNHF